MKYVVIVVVCFFATLAGHYGFKAYDLECALHSEKAANSQTRKELEITVSRSEALAENARRCLAREAKAQAEAAERSAIMDNAATRQRTAQEKEEVVDELTRNAVIDRLNRCLK